MPGTSAGAQKRERTKSGRFAPKSKPQRSRSASRSASRTSSRMSNRSKKVSFQESSGNGAISYYTRRYKAKLKPSLAKLLASVRTTAYNLYQDMYSCSQTCNAGQQTYQFYKSSYGGSNITLGDADYSDLYQIRYSQVGATPPDASNTIKWLSLSVQEELMMTNQDNSTCQMFIYDIVCKKDVNRSPWGVWSSAITDQVSGQTYVYKTVTNATPALTTPGQMPTMINEWNKNFAIKQKTRVILSPGETHIHKKYTNKVRIIDYDRALQNVSMAGITEYTLVITLGFPANDSVNKTNEINYATSKIDVIHKINHKYKRFAYSYNNQFIRQIPAVGFTNNESTMNATTATAQTASVQA